MFLYYRIGDCSLFKVYFMDGYIVQPLLPSDPSPNDILTEYMGRRVFFMMKGPTPRECPSTAAFPNLKATAVFQVCFVAFELCFLCDNLHTIFLGWISFALCQ